jgi:phytoene dehydrogenase-like protein
MPNNPLSSTPRLRVAELRERLRRDLERELRHLAWVRRGPPARQSLARRAEALVSVYQQLQDELSAIREHDGDGFATWLDRTARIGEAMRAQRAWPWWVYSRLVELARHLEREVDRGDS